MAAWAAAAEGRPPGAHPRLTWTCRVHRPLPRPRGLESAGSDRDRGGIGPEGAAAVPPAIVSGVSPAQRRRRWPSCSRVERGRTRRVHGGVRLGAPPRLSPACGRSRSRCDRHQVPSSRRPSTLTPGGRPSGAGRTRPARPPSRRSHRPTGPFPRAQAGRGRCRGGGVASLPMRLKRRYMPYSALYRLRTRVHRSCTERAEGRFEVRSPEARAATSSTSRRPITQPAKKAAPRVCTSNGPAARARCRPSKSARDLAPQSTGRPAGPPALRRSVAQHLLRRLQQPARLWAPPSSTERIHLGRVVDSDSRGSSP